jgi:hypothetical protein
LYELDGVVESGVIILDSTSTLGSISFSLDIPVYNDFLDLYYGDIYGNSH